MAEIDQDGASLTPSEPAPSRFGIAILQRLKGRASDKLLSEASLQPPIMGEECDTVDLPAMNFGR